jgi:hypothetical protein
MRSRAIRLGRERLRTRSPLRRTLFNDAILQNRGINDQNKESKKKRTTRFRPGGTRPPTLFPSLGNPVQVNLHLQSFPLPATLNYNSSDRKSKDHCQHGSEKPRQPSYTWKKHVPITESRVSNSRNA